MVLNNERHIAGLKAPARGGHRSPVRLLAVLLLPVLLLMPQSRSAVIQKGATFRLEGTYTFSSTGATGDSIRWRLDRQLVDEATGSVDQSPGDRLGERSDRDIFSGKPSREEDRVHDSRGRRRGRGLHPDPGVSWRGGFHDSCTSDPTTRENPCVSSSWCRRRPAPCRAIVAVMHGVDRNAQSYIVPWMGFASLRDRIVIAPEFTSALWPSSRSYNLGNMFTESDTTGSPIPEPQWSFSIVQEIVETVRQGLPSGRFSVRYLGALRGSAVRPPHGAFQTAGAHQGGDSRQCRILHVHRYHDRLALWRPVFPARQCTLPSCLHSPGGRSSSCAEPPIRFAIRIWTRRPRPMRRV